uniref:Tumor protein p53-inducible protein 11 n=1 Tax=Caenorhabditis japonica TaxID=281687 RepID=A0A8R1EWP6_CAEJA
MDGISMVTENYDVLNEEYLDNFNNEKLLKIGAISDETIVSRKQSASDLQSRLKTRKLLGVGELAGDNGEIYKSKISQLLGINESLYVRLPRGMFVWNNINSLYFLVFGGLCLFLPRFGILIDHGIDILPNEEILIARYYGVTLIFFGVLFRFILQQREARSDIALLLLVTAVYHVTILIVTTISTGTIKWWSATLRLGLAAGNIFYHAFVDGQGGLYRQLVRVFEDYSFLSYTPTVEEKTSEAVVEKLLDDRETLKSCKKKD